MAFLDEFIIPVILGICLCIGVILKSWLSDASHKYIPTTVAILGVVLAVWMNHWQTTPEVLLKGLVSGLSSTGLHQLYKQHIEKQNN